ncbi:MAG: aldehyde dehydrogenase (NADP(+)), partial [Trueperaceae bacterium]
RGGAFLEAIAEQIEALGPALIERASAESGLPTGRIEGERGRTTGQLRMFAALIREGSWVDARIERADPDRSPVPKPDVHRMQIALGPVVVFAASNFPLAFSVAGGDTASALAAGCPVVVKAHPAHPGTSDLVAQAILKAAEASGMPDGVFSLLHGAGHEVGLGLVRHPLTRAVGFTGSHRAGRALFDAAVAREEPIPVYAEMGSVNPVFVLPGAAAERGDAIASGLVGSVTLGVGQFCTKPGLIFGLDDAATDALFDRLGAAMREAEPGSMLYEGICDAFASGVRRVRDTPGVSVSGEAARDADAARTEARPTAFRTDAATLREQPHLSEELFGPATLSVTAASHDDLLASARALEGHLTATIHATESELEEHQELVRVLERKVGRLIVDGYPTGVDVSSAMQHGGPYPATTDVRTTSVGTAAIHRFARPVAYQAFPQALLPPELRDGNPLGIRRSVDGRPEAG